MLRNQFGRIEKVKKFSFSLCLSILFVEFINHIFGCFFCFHHSVVGVGRLTLSKGLGSLRQPTILRYEVQHILALL